MPTPTIVTRVFMNGNSQAVRIPQELRLDTALVEISRNDAGDLVLHPVQARRGTALLEALSGFDDDFIAALADGTSHQAPPQEREAL